MARNTTKSVMRGQFDAPGLQSIGSLWGGGAKLYFLETEAIAGERLAQGCVVVETRTRDLKSRVQRLLYTTEPAVVKLLPDMSCRFIIN